MSFFRDPLSNFALRVQNAEVALLRNHNAERFSEFSVV
jgi:hypothetical protein